MTVFAVYLELFLIVTEKCVNERLQATLSAPLNRSYRDRHVANDVVYESLVLLEKRITAERMKSKTAVD